MTPRDNSRSAGIARNRTWAVLALAAIGVLIASGLRDSFGTGKGRDHISPEALRAAFDAGEQVGRANIAAKRFDELADDVAKGESARLTLTDGQRRAWCEAFAGGYRAALDEETRKREAAQRR